MKYRLDKYGNKLSMLGYGCMRFPTIEGHDSKIDEEASAALIDYAIKNGVNYFDTAWGYHSGNSEIVSYSQNTLEKAFSLQVNSRATIFQPLRKKRRYLKSSSKNVRWIISIFIFSTTFARKTLSNSLTQNTIYTVI